MSARYFLDTYFLMNPIDVIKKKRLFFEYFSAMTRDRLKRKVHKLYVVPHVLFSKEKFLAVITLEISLSTIQMCLQMSGEMWSPVHHHSAMIALKAFLVWVNTTYVLIQRESFYLDAAYFTSNNIASLFLPFDDSQDSLMIFRAQGSGMFGVAMNEKLLFSLIRIIAVWTFPFWVAAILKQAFINLSCFLMTF